MNYDTFLESHTHNRRAEQHLVNLLRTRVDSAPAFSLFLGAGASVTSGVPTARALMERWRRSAFAASSRMQTYDEWVKEQDWYGVDDEYSRLFELVFDQPSQRRAVIENAVSDARPSWAYAYLVSLLEQRLFNVVFTTNFDDLLNEACYRYSGLRPLVCAHDSAVSSIRLTSIRPKVIKLHGDFLYDSIKNTSSELQSLEGNMREKFMEFAREYGMVVVGYSGGDKSIMDLLDVLVRSDNFFRHGIYWCVRKGATPGPRLRQLLRNDRVFWVEIEGADELFCTLAHGVGSGLPSGVTAPHQAALSNISHLLDPEREPTAPGIRPDYGRTKELFQKVCALLEVPGNGNGQPESTREIAESLRDRITPRLLAIAAMEAKKYGEAVEMNRRIRMGNPSVEDSLLSRWEEVRCLLLLGGKEAEVRNVLALPYPGSSNGDSDFYMMLSYFWLYICDGDQALAAADAALSLNEANTPALVNRALALLQLGRAEEVEQIVRRLQGERVETHHRAAGFGLAGKFNEMLQCLQRSIATGDYSATGALIDVVWRPFWAIPAFAEGLKPFLGTKPAAFEYLPTCPPSIQEKALTARVLARLAPERPAATTRSSRKSSAKATRVK